MCVMLLLASRASRRRAFSMPRRWTWAAASRRLPVSVWLARRSLALRAARTSWGLGCVLAPAWGLGVGPGLGDLLGLLLEVAAEGGVGHPESGGQGQDAEALAVVVALGQVLVQDAADAGLGGNVGGPGHADARLAVCWERNAVISARRASSRAAAAGAGPGGRRAVGRCGRSRAGPQRPDSVRRRACVPARRTRFNETPSRIGPG